MCLFGYELPKEISMLYWKRTERENSGNVFALVIQPIEIWNKTIVFFRLTKHHFQFQKTSNQMSSETEPVLTTQLTTNPFNLARFFTKKTFLISCGSEVGVCFLPLVCVCIVQDLWPLYTEVIKGIRARKI